MRRIYVRVFTEYFDYAGQFVFRNRMSDMEARSISRTFVAVYLVSACAFLLDASLIAQLPQGFRLSRPIAVELLLAAVLTGCALVLEARHYRRLAIACFALANVVALKTINIIGHLAPAYIGRNFDFIDDALMMSDPSSASIGSRISSGTSSIRSLPRSAACLI